MRCTPEEANMIFRCGEIMGIASKIDQQMLEDFLKHPGDDFRYTDVCKAVLGLVKLVRGSDR